MGLGLRKQYGQLLDQTAAQPAAQAEQPAPQKQSAFEKRQSQFQSGGIARAAGTANKYLSRAVPFLPNYENFVTGGEDVAEKRLKGASDYVPGAIIGEEAGAAIGKASGMKNIKGGATGRDLSGDFDLDRGLRLGGDVASAATLFAGGSLGNMAAKGAAARFGVGAATGGIEAARTGNNIVGGMVIGGALDLAMPGLARTTGKVSSKIKEKLAPLFNKAIPESVKRNVARRVQKLQTNIQDDLIAMISPTGKEFKDFGTETINRAGEGLVKNVDDIMKDIPAGGKNISEQWGAISKNTKSVLKGKRENMKKVLKDVGDSEINITGSDDLLAPIQDKLSKRDEAYRDPQKIAMAEREIENLRAAITGKSKRQGEIATVKLNDVIEIERSLGRQIKDFDSAYGQLTDEQQVKKDMYNILRDVIDEAIDDPAYKTARKEVSELIDLDQKMQQGRTKAGASASKEISGIIGKLKDHPLLTGGAAGATLGIIANQMGLDPETSTGVTLAATVIASGQIKKAQRLNLSPRQRMLAIQEGQKMLAKLESLVPGIRKKVLSNPAMLEKALLSPEVEQAIMSSIARFKEGVTKD